MTVEVEAPHVEGMARENWPVTAVAALSPDVDPLTMLTTRGLRYKDKASLMAMAVSDHLLSESGTREDLARNSSRVAVVVASDHSNADTVERVAREIQGAGIYATSPMDLPNASPNVVASSVSILHGFRGPNLLVSGRPTSMAVALQVSRRLLAADRADHVVLLGVAPSTEAALALNGAAGAVGMLLERDARAMAVCGTVDETGMFPRVEFEPEFNRLWEWFTSGAPDNSSSSEMSPRGMNDDDRR